MIAFGFFSFNIPETTIDISDILVQSSIPMVTSMINTSNLITISPTIDAQKKTTKPVCLKPAEQNAYMQGSRCNIAVPTEHYVYTSNQLRLIGKQYKDKNIPRILPFGAIRQIRDLCLNRKKQKNSQEKSS